MAKRIRKPRKFSRLNYNARIGELFRLVNSPDTDVQCRTLAIADWDDIDQADAIALLVPLAFHPSADVRQLVALQLATMADAADDPRGVQALVTLAADGEAKVRAAAARSRYIATRFGLTPDDPFAKSPGENLVRWEQDEETTVFSFRCPDLSAVRQALAIVAGIAGKQMIHRSDEKQTQSPQKTGCQVDRSTHLPDLIVDEQQIESFDLPREGTPKDVLGISKASTRLPELLVDN